MEQMNIRIELLNLQLKAPQLNAAEFAAKFSLIAEEYNRLQKLQQTPCSTLRELLVQKLTGLLKQPPAKSDTEILWRSAEISTLEDVLMLMDEQQPVA